MTRTLVIIYGDERSVVGDVESEKNTHARAVTHDVKGLTRPISLDGEICHHDKLSQGVGGKDEPVWSMVMPIRLQDEKSGKKI